MLVVKCIYKENITCIEAQKLVCTSKKFLTAQHVTTRPSPAFHLFGFLCSLMNRFIRFLTFFVVSALLVVAVVVFVLSDHLLKRTDFTVPAHHSMAVIGHSHAECAYNDSLIPGLSNLAFSGETYFYSYHKAKLLLENNPQISTLFIECSNNQITEEMEDWTWSTNSLGKRLQEFGMFMPGSDHWYLWRHNPYGYMNAWSMLPSEYLGFIRNKEFAFFPRTGAFRSLTREKTDSIVAARQANPDLQPIHIPFSDHNPKYLRKMIDLCKSKNCKVFLVRSPLHPLYDRLINEEEFQRVVKEQFADVPFLDARHFPLHNSQFGDLEHLNGKGAREYSRFFQSVLDSGLLHTATPTELFNRQMDHYQRIKGE